MSIFNEIAVSLEPIEHACPKCGARVYLRSACPGYGSKGDGRGVMVCHPESDCGNSLRAECAQWLIDQENGVEHPIDFDPCDWKYQYPINPDRDESGENAASRPSWADEIPEWRT